MTTYYVSQSGQDNNLGDLSNPVKSIQQAIDKATAGDVILVEAGTYAPAEFKNKNGTESDPITIKAAPGNEGKVNISSGTYDSKSGISIQNSSNIVVENLNFSKSLFGISVKKSNNVTLQNNQIYDVGQEAIIVNDNSSYVEITDNFISNTGNKESRFGEGIYLGDGSEAGDRTNNIAIEGNDISQTSSEGIDIKPYVSNVIVENNSIHDINTEVSGALTIGLNHKYGGGNFTNADNVIVRNNRFWNISSNSRWKDGNAISATSSATIYNNEISNYQHRGIFIHEAPAENQFKIYHNTVYHADREGEDGDISVKKTDANVDIRNNIGYEDGNNIPASADLFVDAANKNFSLKSEAQAVDAGVNSLGIDNDLNGFDRNIGTAPDLGAYEFEVVTPTVEERPLLNENLTFPPDDSLLSPNESNADRDTISNDISDNLAAKEQIESNTNQDSNFFISTDEMFTNDRASFGTGNFMATNDSLLNTTEMSQDILIDPNLPLSVDIPTYGF